MQQQKEELSCNQKPCLGNTVKGSLGTRGDEFIDGFVDDISIGVKKGLKYMYHKALDYFFRTSN
jgi:hypothetical protein